MKRPEIAVVGGGLSGRLLAWRAARSGRQVALYEASGRLGEGAAAWAAAGTSAPLPFGAITAPGRSTDEP